MVGRWPLHVQELINRCLTKPRELRERHEQLLIRDSVASGIRRSDAVPFVSVSGWGLSLTTDLAVPLVMPPRKRGPRRQPVPTLRRHHDEAARD
jgi:hypothetical protein